MLVRVTDPVKITLTGAPETMLATLYGRAQDATSPDSVLHDHYAAEAVARIDYDFSKTKIKGTQAIGVALRARQLDDWTSEFLTAHREATVLHLACGLDTRVFRINPSETVRWVDVDYPDVIALRRALLPCRDGDYRMIGSSVSEVTWLDSIPADRPTLAVFEGLTMYLTEPRGSHSSGVSPADSPAVSWLSTATAASASNYRNWCRRCATREPRCIGESTIPDR